MGSKREEYPDEPSKVLDEIYANPAYQMSSEEFSRLLSSEGFTRLLMWGTGTMGKAEVSANMKENAEGVMEHDGSYTHEWRPCGE